MFGISWIDMIGTYEQRKVANYKNDIFEIDTVRVTDRRFPYETAIRHKNFNDGDWIVLGFSSTKEEAQEYHDKCVEQFTFSPYPVVIEDAYTFKEYPIVYVKEEK